MLAAGEWYKKVLARRAVVGNSTPDWHAICQEVFDGTSAKETRSMLILDDNSIGISSVNETVSAGKANADVTEPSTKIEREKRCRNLRHLFVLNARLSVFSSHSYIEPIIIFVAIQAQPFADGKADPVSTSGFAATIAYIRIK